MSYNDTMTPGSAVADTLQNILASQKAEKRQQLLDSLNVANVNSEMDYRKQQAASLAEDRAAQAMQRQALAEKYRSDISNRENFGKYLSTFKASHPDLDPSMASAIDLAGASGDPELTRTLISNLAGASSKPQGGNLITLDESGNPTDTGQWVEPGQRVMQTQRPLAPPRDMGSPIGPAEDEKGNRIPGKYVVWLNGKMVVQDLPGVAAVGGKGDPKTKVVKPYDEAAFARFKSAMQSTSPAAANARSIAMQDLINSVRDADPKEAESIKADVRAILGHPEARSLSADALATSGALNGTPEHVSKVKEILSVIRGQ